MRKLTLSLLLFVLVFASFSSQFSVKAAPAGSSGYDVLDAVNAFRQTKGLSPFNPNAILMGIAQGQSDFLAARGYGGNDGLGGTDETQRAQAAGYGSGATILCDEAWALARSPEEAIELWQDDEHLAILLSTKFVDGGAGSTFTKDGNYFYIVDVCYTGSPGGSGGSGLPSPTSGGSQQTPSSGFQTATPGADGWIRHTVQNGESLYSIAVDYGVSLNDLKTINSLGSDAIYVGQKLKIKQLPTPTATLTATATKQPTRTPRPSRTPLPPTATRSPSAQASITSTPTDQPAPGPASFLASVDPALAGIGVLGFVGLGLMVVGTILKRRK